VWDAQQPAMHSSLQCTAACNVQEAAMHSGFVAACTASRLWVRQPSKSAMTVGNTQVSKEERFT